LATLTGDHYVAGLETGDHPSVVAVGAAKLDGYQGWRAVLEYEHRPRCALGLWRTIASAIRALSACRLAALTLAAARLPGLALPLARLTLPGLALPLAHLTLPALPLALATLRLIALAALGLCALRLVACSRLRGRIGGRLVPA
jgi:hypothetical protein